MVRSGYRNDSVVYLDFLFERQTGFFLLQIYTPLTLIVFCSWVSFWLVKTEAVRKNIINLPSNTQNNPFYRAGRFLRERL